jgi:hypothetical protein
MTAPDMETWRPAAGFEGIYDVSNHGRVRRVGRAARNGNGRGGGARIGHVLKLRTTPGGYLRAQLWRDGKPCPRLVHTLVATTFIGPCPAGLDVNHIDGVKTNNQPSNLEYVTRSDNNLHAWRTGLCDGPRHLVTGEDHHNAKLTAEDVREIRRLYQPGSYGTPRLAKQFGVNAKTIHLIISGRTWKEVA